MGSQLPEVVRSTCSICQNFCGLLAYKMGDRVIKLEGDPDNPRNLGHLCAKGLSGFLTLYSPKRFRRPVKRTNPVKGIGVDPNWVEISWEEAIETVADKVRQAMQVDPKRIAINTFDHTAIYGGVQSAWADAVGCSRIGAGGFLCGVGVHPIIFLNTATFEHVVDAEYAKYILLLGAQAGSIIHYDTMNAAKHIAEKRPGGIKVVSVDPLASYAGSKAEEWVPIRPGTDGAFVLGLANLLVNEYRIYDSEFLKEKTNAPYLIGQDGRYVRDHGTSKPLVWDTVDNQQKMFDAEVKDHALEGCYMIGSEECKPSFQLIKDHLRRYTLEYVSQVTTIPVETIKRIAREIGDAACIGQTIEIDGVKMPYRPVSIVWYRGISSHKNSFLTSCAAMLLSVLLGAIQVPGAMHGHPRLDEYVTEDGMLAPKATAGQSLRSMPYPPRTVKKPRSLDAIELFPVAHGAHGVFAWVASCPERFGYGENEYSLPEILITFRANNVENTVSPKMLEEIYRRIPLVVAFAVEPDRTTDLADIVIPDLHHLEKLAETVNNRIDEPGYWYAAKPVVKPPFDSPYDQMVNPGEVFLVIAERAGFLRRVYETLNSTWRLQGTPYELDPSGRYSYLELVDRHLKRELDHDKGLDWLLSQEGGLVVWKASAQERYVGPFRKGRIHLYYEFLLGAGEQVRKLTEELDIPWDTSDYQPIPDWKPCPSYSKRSSDTELFITNYKTPVMSHGFTRANPILRRLTESHRLDAVLINSETAKRKGIRDEDEVWIETDGGYKTKVIALTSERVHPEVVASMQHKLLRGVEFNEMLMPSDESVGFVNASIDSCRLVKVSRA